MRKLCTAAVLCGSWHRACDGFAMSPTHLTAPIVPSYCASCAAALPPTHPTTRFARLGGGPLHRAALPSCSAASAAAGASAWQLFIAFTCGGLFFSSALAAVGAVYALGVDNVRQIAVLFREISRRVWVLLVRELGAARDALLGDATLPEAWSSAQAELSTSSGIRKLREQSARVWRALRWAEAWLVLSTGIGEARRTAVEGVEALRLEASLYAGAVGPAGLVPLQYALDRFTPLALSDALERVLSESLRGVQTAQLRGLELRSFSAGSIPPRLVSARTYELEGALACDFDVRWESALTAKIDLLPSGGMGARVPVSVSNVRFAGPVRLILTPLLKSAPGYGATLLSLLAMPKVGLDVKVAGGEVTKVPWLRSELERAIEKAVAEQCLWPRRIVLPTPAPPPPTAPKPPTLLSAEQLSALANDDPLLQAEKKLAEQPAARSWARNASRSVVDAVALETFDIFVGQEGERLEHGDEGDALQPPAAVKRKAWWRDPWRQFSLANAK